MFKNEKITVMSFKDRAIKLEDEGGRVVSLIFISGEKVIVRGEFFAKETTIEPPKINNVD